MKNRFRLICLILTAALAAGCAGSGGHVDVTAPPETAAVTPSPEPVPSPELTPTLEPAPSPTPALPLSGVVIGLDPGHQTVPNGDPEPNAPGSDVMKKKVSSGTHGVESGVWEYEVNLAVGLLLRDMLEAAGATVIMTRTVNDVDISNSERALLFNDAEVDLAVRIHCNGNSNPDAAGAFMLVPASGACCEESAAAAEAIIAAYCAATGLEDLGVTPRSDQTGFNWCCRPIVCIEMGHMTNAAEDAYLTDPGNQLIMARGIADGVTEYFRP